MSGQVIEILRTLYDPEIPVNIYDLGLIYGLDVNEANGKVNIRLDPDCPRLPGSANLSGIGTQYG